MRVLPIRNKVLGWWVLVIRVLPIRNKLGQRLAEAYGAMPGLSIKASARASPKASLVMD